MRESYGDEEKNNLGFRTMSRKKFWVWLLALGIQWKQISETLTKVLEGIVLLKKSQAGMKSSLLGQAYPLFANLHEKKVGY